MKGYGKKKGKGKGYKMMAYSKTDGDKTMDYTKGASAKYAKDARVKESTAKRFV